MPVTAMGQERLTLALCQMPVVPHANDNLHTAAHMLRNAARSGADIAILPEMFICPYRPETFFRYIQEGYDIEAMEMLAQTAKEHGIWVVGGTIPERAGECIYNTCYIYDPNGKQAGRYRKAHLFDATLASGECYRESQYVSPGRERLCLEPIGIGVVVCYDLRFPEWIVPMARKGAWLIVAPSAFTIPTGQMHWELLLRARAIDTQAFVAGVSPARLEGQSNQPYAHTMLIGPDGSVIASAGLEEVLLICEVDHALARQVRAQLPILDHRNI